MKILFKIVLVLLFVINASTLQAQERFGGIMLYTLREEMKEKPKSVIDSVAKIGYKYIEDAGYSKGKFYGMKPVDFKKYLSSKQLVPISSHQGSINFENADSIINAVKIAGFKYLVIPIPPMGKFTFDPATSKMGMKGSVEDLANVLNILGKKCKKEEIQLLYHNHDFEFSPNEDGIIPIEYLLQNTKPEWVNFEIDIYWAKKSGADPINYFQKFPGRFKMWHIKDMDEEGRFAPIGEGVIEFKRIFQFKGLAGMEYYMVEQDQTFNMTPLEAIKVSHEALIDLNLNK